MSHKILSFDVGIKNLAYCLLEYTNIENNKKYKYKNGDVRTR